MITLQLFVSLTVPVSPSRCANKCVDPQPLPPGPLGNFARYAFTNFSPCSVSRLSSPSHSPPRRLVVLITAYIPIALVRTPCHADILLESPPDNYNMVFRFSTNFEIVNDALFMIRIFCIEDPSVPQSPQTHSPQTTFQLFWFPDA